jgi:hypothetical protein
VVEWLPGFVFRLRPATGEVEAWVAEDESVLLLSADTRMVVQYLKPPPPAAPHAQTDGAAAVAPVDPKDCIRVYSAAALPGAVRAPHTGLPRYVERVGTFPSSYCCVCVMRSSGVWLQSVQRCGGGAACAAFSQRHMATAAATGRTRAELYCTRSGLIRRYSYILRSAAHIRFVLAAQARTLPLVSSHVLERCDVPDVGLCTAYADGRVRIVFRDGTLLEMDGGARLVDATLPDDRAIRATTAHPVGIEQCAYTSFAAITAAMR